MAISPNLSGRAGGAQIIIQVEGLVPALNRWAAMSPTFNKEIRSASVDLIREIVVEAQSAASYAPNPRQAMEAAKGLRPKPDRIPVIRLSANTNFVSRSRPNRKRRTKVLRGDVFYGSEFGSNNFRQFPERSPSLGGGNRGYWFWPTIEAMSPKIASRYLESVENILQKMSKA